MNRIERFSPKQRVALTWWCPPSPHAGRLGIICDGAVRSGKTLSMGLSFVAWSLAAFREESFALCGRTIASLRRNLLTELLPRLGELGFWYREQQSRNLIEIGRGGRSNRYYLFGGKDESSAAAIQGVTLAGVLLDEAALMPRSFVEQAVARCSREGSRLWFNCNPEYPRHWFYQEWILRAGEKNLLYLHFTMEDNPSLSPQMRRRYATLYSGSFYQRFVEGKWVAASGLVYPMFSEERCVAQPPAWCQEYYLSCDYGTVNPFSLGLWGLRDGVWYRIAEFYHDSRATGRQMTDEEYYRQLEILAGNRAVIGVVADPSAASFLECIRRHGRFRPIPGKNDVVPGIARVADALQKGRIKIGPRCRDAIREFGSYRWDDGAREDKPVKEFDHAMDEIRYFVSTVMAGEQGGFCALSPGRTPEGGWQ